MINKLIETGNKFKKEFTVEYLGGSKYGINKEYENEYIQWLSRVGVFAEGKLKSKYPSMTKEIIRIISDKSTMLENYNIIIGYLESVNELGF